MITIDRLAQRFADVANILDSITVKGVVNAKLIAQAFDICSNTVSELKETINELQNESNTPISETSQEVGDNDGEPLAD